jgi:hypothetical protein
VLKPVYSIVTTVVKRLKPIKYMILLVFLALLEMNSATKVQRAPSGATQVQERGPVYHPLRVKPYSKRTMKA